MDRLQTMTVFVAVTEESGFAPAARRLNMSPASVTRAVSDLEARLGARLLHRTTRSLSLTEAGERYLSDCRRILSEIDEADRHAAGVHGSPRGLVSVTGPVVFGREVLTSLLVDLQSQHPEIAISSMFVDRIVHMIDEGIDVAVRLCELPDSSLTAVRVGAVRRILCASPGYLEQHGRPSTPKDLANHEIVNFTHETPRDEWHFHQDGSARSFKVTSKLRFNFADGAISAAVAGRGITRVLSYMVANQLQSGALEIILEEYEPPIVPVHVVHKESSKTSARVRTVVDHLVKALRAEPKIREQTSPN